MKRKEYRISWLEWHDEIGYVVREKKHLWIFSWWKTITRPMSFNEAEQYYQACQSIIEIYE